MPRNYTDENKIQAELGWLNNQEKNAELFNEIVEDKSMQVIAGLKSTFPPGYRLVRRDIDERVFTIALINDNEEEVVYFIRAEVWEEKALAVKPATQVILWRTPQVKYRPITSGITEIIFRDYLLERYNIVASDGSHTLPGKEFWVRQLGYALEFNEYVYRYDLIKCELLRITDHRVIIENTCDLWGNDVAYESILALISKTELTLQSEN